MRRTAVDTAVTQSAAPDISAGENLTADPVQLRLSCYTTNLVRYLEQDIPGVHSRVATAIRLAVRTDLPPGELAFSHHSRLDVTDDGQALDYRVADRWERTREGLLHELETERRVLAAANTRHMPWSAAFERHAAPHWVLIREHRGGRWLVDDHFSALTPFGEQEPFLGWLEDAELARALTPVADPAPEVARRDRLALGTAIHVPHADQHRWLVRVPATADEVPAPDEGTWLLDPVPVLAHIRDVLVDDPTAAGRYADDLWAAGCHQAHRNDALVTQGLVVPERADEVTAAWLELPKALRFAAQSAARGRPRPGVVEKAFAQLIRSTEALETGTPAPTPEG